MAKNKYVKQKQQWSTDGTNWYDVEPLNYRAGKLIELDSEDCKDAPQPPVDPDDDITKHPYYGEYFTIEFSDDTYMYLQNTVKDTFYYSLNGSVWKKMSNLTTVKKNDKMRIKRNGGIVKYYDNIYPIFYPGDDDVKVKYYGNINSLFAGDDFKTDLTVYDWILENSRVLGMFGQSGHNIFFSTENEIDCSDLVIPYTEVKPYMYYCMFTSTKIKKFPQIPMTTEVAENCYNSTFRYCMELTNAPSILPATKLAPYCYFQMFKDCKSLINAPELPAKTLVNQCYSQMFNNCTKINYVKCLAVDDVSVDSFTYTYLWLSNVSPTGTFVKKRGVEWLISSSGIPSGWTVEEVD